MEGAYLNMFFYEPAGEGRAKILRKEADKVLPEMS